MHWNNLTNRYQSPSKYALWSVLFFGVLTSFAFAPYQLWPIAFVSIAALLLTLKKVSPGQAFKLTWWFAMAMNLPTLWWIHVSMTEFGDLPLPAAFFLVALLCAYLSLYPSAAAWVLNRFFPEQNFIRFLFAFPSLWLISDWGIGHILTGFPWMWLGYSQINTWLTGYAPILGVQGITLAVLLSASAFVLFIQSRKVLWLLIPPFLFFTGYGLQNQNWTQEGDEVDFALVQGNIPQSLKWDPNHIKPTLTRYIDLSRKNNDADIIVWPESAIPALENDMREFMINIDDAMRSQKIGFITGIQYYDQSQDRFYNAVIGSGLIDAKGEQSYQYGQKNRWYKAHLVPVGEFVPFGDLLRPIAPFFNLPMSSFTAGEPIQPNILSKGYKFATAICYETEFSDEMRKNINPDTQFIVNVSNDSWFGTSDGPLQHQEIARMRAIEFGRPLLRATNSGVTIAFDAKGKTLGVIPQFEEKVLRVKAKATTGLTPYTTLGSVPLILFCAVSLGLGLILRRRFQA